MTLSVIGQMYEQTADAGRELFLAYSAGLFEVGSGKGADAICGVFNSLFKFLKKLFAGRSRVGFPFECGNLRGAELIAFRVGEQAIEAARNVAQME